jgi:Manganese containing catalase
MRRFSDLRSQSQTKHVPNIYQEKFMYHHVKKPMFTVRVDEPDPAFGNMLLEQFGGANGELAAAM